MTPTATRTRAAVARAWSPTGSPAGVAAVATVAGVAFVVARLVLVAHGNPTVFVVAGTDHVSTNLLPRGFVVRAGSGYDGQFYYRMALDPADLRRSASGIRLDTLGRLERIGYPALAWVLAAGRRSLVPWSLIVVNVLGLGALGFGAAQLAVASGRSAWWGLTLVGYWGYPWSAGRDLTEITAAAFLVLSLAAYRRQAHRAAALLLLAAVLTKEDAAYVVAILAASRLVPMVLHRRADGPRPGRADLAWAVPLLGFATWQLVVRAADGILPIHASGSANLGLPFDGMVQGVRHYVATFPSIAAGLWWGELLLLVVVTVTAGRSLRTSTAPVHEKVAWGAVVLVAACAAPGIWLGDVGFRSLDDVYLFSWIVLLGSERPLRALSRTTAVAWVVVAVELVHFL